MGHRAGRHSVGEKRRISRALPALAAFGMAVLLCFFANPVLAGENITYDGETGSEPIIWTDGDYGYTYATLGTTGSDSGNSNSISGNTVTVKNVVVSPPEQLPGNHQYPLKSITVVGANNSTDSNPVTGNTVIIENSEFDHDGSFGYTLDDPNQDYLYSTVYGGAAGPEYAISGHFVSSPISDYNANPSANNNQVKVQHSIIERVTGGYAPSRREDPTGYDLGANTIANSAANNNQVEINGGSTIDWVNGGRASSDIYFPSYGPNPGDIPPSDNLTVTANSTANGNEVVIKGGSTVGEVDGGDAAVSIHIPADFDSDLGVLIFSPTIVNGTATATTNDNRVIIEESTIGEGIDAGSADIYVSATDVSGTTATALAKNNTIEINGSSTVVKDEILAGDSHISGNFSSASTSTAEGNGVIINDGTVEIENDAIVGGVAEIGGSDYGYSDSYGNTAEMHIPDNGGSAAATGNSVAINGGTVTVRKVYHGDSEDDDYVGIVGGAAESETGSATATYNTVAITGGDVKAEGYGIVGGWAGSSSGDATAMHNTVEISGGTVEGDIYGGYADLHHVLLEHPGDYNSSDASPTATNNKVKVQNSTMENVTGGNAIRFEYQTVEAGDYEINYSSSATANSNQVEIGAGDIVRNVTGGDSTVALQLFPLGGPAPFTPFDGNVAITATTHSTANSNQVKVTGGTAGDVIAGYTDVYINTLTNYHYSSGEVETDIIGTIDGILTATANENKVIVEGGTIEDVLGGDASATAIGRDASDFTATSIAKNNKVEINGDNTVVVAEKLANPAKNL